MLRNVVEVLGEASPGLQHITLLQGTKAYGAHWGPARTVSKESDGRYMPPNFYYAQEDFLREQQASRGWAWTALRPQLVSGFALGSPSNGIAALGAYAAICKELGLPLRCPGAAHRILEASDTRLLARAADWAASTPECDGQAYNITNGDCFVWHEIWPGLAELFDMDWAPPHPMPLQAAMADKGPVWERIRRRHGLEYPLESLVPSWEFADMLFASGSHQAFGAGAEVPAILVSTIKARTHGFHDCIDTEQMFAEWIEVYRRWRALPG
jgi:nucleoside-diphosphate-sugar epimerase